MRKSSQELGANAMTYASIVERTVSFSSFDCNSTGQLATIMKKLVLLTSIQFSKISITTTIKHIYDFLPIMILWW